MSFCFASAHTKVAIAAMDTITDDTTAGMRYLNACTSGVRPRPQLVPTYCSGRKQKIGREIVQNIMKPTGVIVNMCTDGEQHADDLLNSFVCMPALGPKVFFKE
jgi:hypothetical protein